MSVRSAHTPMIFSLFRHFGMWSVGGGLHTAPVPVNAFLGRLLASFVWPPNVTAFVRSQITERYRGYAEATQA